jgi:hypothetical protein
MKDINNKMFSTKIREELDSKIIQAINMINETMLRNYLNEVVNFGPRATGTYGCEKAGEYLYNQFIEMGLDTRYHYWKSIGKLIPLRFYKDKNVIGRLEGINESCEEIIVFNAHYDTVKVSPGANDDGSGVAAVLAAAYVLKNFNFNRTIEFVLFSGEEINLIGSRAYVEKIYQNNTELLVEFNADMIGYVETQSGFENVSISYTQDAKWMFDKIQLVNNNSGINFNIRSNWNIEPYGKRGGSDFYDFVQYGYDAIAFWESEWNATYFHTKDDTIDHINFEYLTNVTKLIVGSIAYMADVENHQPKIRIGAPRRGKSYFEDRQIRNLRHDRIRIFDDFLICTEVESGNSPIERVEFYYDDKLIFTDYEIPYQWRLNKRSIGKHMIRVVIFDEIGRYSSDEIRIYYRNLYLNI